MRVKKSSMTETLFYRLPWQSTRVYPGAHSGQMLGAGQLFKRHEPLVASPDPRRIDLRASVLDPFDNYRVRVYQQQSRVDVYLLADLSASMGYAGKRQAIVQFLQALARSAFGYGDRFGFIGGGACIEQRWLLPVSHHIGPVTALAEQLANAELTDSALGLLTAAAYLPSGKSLVFLLTDAHFPIKALRELLGSLQGHDVIPLVLWDAGEYTRLPEWGIMAFQDIENGRRRTVLLRPALRQKIIAAYGQRQKKLKQVFRAFGSEPVFIESCDIPVINRHLQQRVA